MPELPEVETVRAGLEDMLQGQPVIKKVRLMRADIRFPIPKKLPAFLEGQPVLAVRRRAKYLLIDTPRGTLLSHLGMTGSWRMSKPGDEDKHDHCYIEFEDGRRLAFRDPRRFGVLDFIQPNAENQHKLLKNLGPEPLDTEAFNGEALFRKSRGRRVAVKVFIMDQKVVVGVGNIYASEALFLAGVRPQKLAGRLTKQECDRLADEIQKVLRKSIEAGGSSIRDYRQAGGEAGSFQNAHKVYDRSGQPCVTCETPLRSKVIGGRSTFWCTKCQR